MGSFLCSYFKVSHRAAQKLNLSVTVVSSFAQDMVGHVKMRKCVFKESDDCFQSTCSGTDSLKILAELSNIFDFILLYMAVLPWLHH